MRLALVQMRAGSLAKRLKAGKRDPDPLSLTEHHDAATPLGKSDHTMTRHSSTGKGGLSNTEAQRLSCVCALCVYVCGVYLGRRSRWVCLTG